MTRLGYPLSQAHRLTGMAVRQLGRHAVGWSQILYGRDLRDLPEVPNDQALASGWCAAEQFVTMRKHPEARRAPIYDRRLAAGDRCYFLRVDGRIASSNWVALDRGAALCGQDPEIHFRTLQPGEAFTYDLYTYLGYRRRGLGAVLKLRLLRALRDQGLQRVYGLVDPRNVASSRLHIRLGYSPVEEIYLYRIAKKCYVFQRPAGSAVSDWVAEMREQMQ